MNSRIAAAEKRLTPTQEARLHRLARARAFLGEREAGPLHEFYMQKIKTERELRDLESEIKRMANPREVKKRFAEDVVGASVCFGLAGKGTDEMMLALITEKQADNAEQIAQSLVDCASAGRRERAKAADALARTVIVNNKTREELKRRGCLIFGNPVVGVGAAKDALAELLGNYDRALRFVSALENRIKDANDRVGWSIPLTVIGSTIASMTLIKMALSIDLEKVNRLSQALMQAVENNPLGIAVILLSVGAIANGIYAGISGMLKYMVIEPEKLLDSQNAEHEN